MNAKDILDVSPVFADSKVQIPDYVRKLLDIKPGDRLVWLRDTEGDAVIIVKQERVQVR